MAGRGRSVQGIRAVLEDDYADLFLRSPVSPKSLAEVKIRTTYRIKIDDAVEELVKALLLMGVKTIRSCEGHPPPRDINVDSEWARSYGTFMHGERPWVETYDGPAIGALRSLVSTFNERSEIKWNIREVAPILGLIEVDRVLGLSPVNVAGNKRELEKLQHSAGELALFIFTSTGRERAALLSKLQRKDPVA
jgi:hypothetical protein